MPSVFIISELIVLFPVKVSHQSSYAYFIFMLIKLVNSTALDRYGKDISFTPPEHNVMSSIF